MHTPLVFLYTDVSSNDLEQVSIHCVFVIRYKIWAEEQIVHNFCNIINKITLHALRISNFIRSMQKTIVSDFHIFMQQVMRTPVLN